jgi:hypothetical protein
MFHVEHYLGLTYSLRELRECSTWNIHSHFPQGMFHVEHFCGKSAPKQP